MLPVHGRVKALLQSSTHNGAAIPGGATLHQPFQRAAGINGTPYGLPLFIPFRAGAGYASRWNRRHGLP